MTTALIWALYVVAACITGGYVYEKLEESRQEDEAWAFICGLLWPLTVAVGVLIAVCKVVFGTLLLLADFGRWIARGEKWT